MSTDNQAPRKFDHGKPQMNLIPTAAIVEMGKVLAFGAQKYDRGNWAKGLATSRYFDAAMRHLWAWNAGEEKDPESGLSHLAHAAVNIAFMIWNMAFRPDLDDRWSPIYAVGAKAEQPAVTPVVDVGNYAWFRVYDAITFEIQSPVFVSRELAIKWDKQDSENQGIEYLFAHDKAYDVLECSKDGVPVRRT